MDDPALKIGVALSSGGAAGMAHVGVLQELLAAKIPIHAVAGTSAGAMVGAAYAAGHLTAFRDTMCALTHRRVLWLFDPTWPHSGLLEGRRALELVHPYIGESIESLPRPYAAVATDLNSGAEVVLRRGDVFEAIRASIAIPGLFTPQHWQGRLLVDGGLVNPLPVDVARRLGADFVIAVSVLDIPDGAITPRPSEPKGLTSQLLKRFHARLHEQAASGRPKVANPKRTSPKGPVGDLGLIDILSRASTVVQAHMAMSQLREHPPDYFIAVRLQGIGTFDFHRSADAVAAGRAAARELLPQLREALAAAIPLYRRVTHWLDDATLRLRRGNG